MQHHLIIFAELSRTERKTKEASLGRRNHMTGHLKKFSFTTAGYVVRNYDKIGCVGNKSALNDFSKLT